MKEQKQHVWLLGLVSTTALLLTTLAPQAQALDLEELVDGKASINFRYRYEDVSQDGVAEDAGASTLRTRFTWNSGLMDGFRLGVEADHVSLIGSESYNSTVNGKTQYPVVADPEGLDLNQAFIGYTGDSLQLDFGRQRILHGSQRFVGGVGWRQNEQTYDALRLQPRLESWTVDYSYVWNVNRIFGPDDGAQPADWHGNSHLLLVGRPINETQKIELFGYLLDFENANGPPNSTSTWGLGYKGKFGPTTLSASVATQSDYADSPLDYSTQFYSLQADISVSPVTFTLGYEVLGSDGGNAAFRTPLATLHKFQGWSDKFLGTPANGLRDAYVGARGKVQGFGWSLVWHNFSADEGSADYGDELNLVVNYAFNSKVSVQFKGADYSADSFATDTTKFWLTTVVKL